MKDGGLLRLVSIDPPHKGAHTCSENNCCHNAVHSVAQTWYTCQGGFTLLVASTYDPGCKMQCRYS